MSDRDGPLERFESIRRTAASVAPAWVRDRDPIVLAVGAIVVVGLLARVLFLGARIAHWDEARVGYWILYAQRESAFAYRRIIHGPFVQHVDRYLFAAFGPSDFLARLPVAVVGSLLPLAALLFREHLRKSETVVLAALLAANPVLLYYSRFLRSDLLVATFMILALGCLVRLYDTGDVRYLYGAAPLLAFGIASKENAVIYLLTWIGGAALLVDHYLFRPYDDRAIADRLRERWWASLRRISDRVDADDPFSVTTAASVTGRYLARRYLPHAIGATVVFFGVLLFMFAPRGAGEPGLQYPPVTGGESNVIGLWQGITNPGLFPEMVSQTASHSATEYAKWFGHASETGGDRSLVEQYVQFLGFYLDVMRQFAAPTLFFGVVGFLWERFGSVERRGFVMFFGYVGFVSILGYPLGMDIAAAWNTTHAIVPLAVPAAVGIALVGRWGYATVADRDPVSVGLAAVVLLLVVGTVGSVSVGAVYLDAQSHESDLVQYGQPADDMRPALDRIERLSAENEGVDVLVYGEYYVDQNEPGLNTRPICTGAGGWYNGLPLSWYLALEQSNVTCATNASTLSEGLASNPPIIIARTSQADPVLESVSGYSNVTYRLRASPEGSSGAVETIYLFDEDRLDPATVETLRENM
jgi:uncharacterized protein (TIGR03663 family)